MWVQIHYRYKIQWQIFYLNKVIISFIYICDLNHPVGCWMVCWDLRKIKVFMCFTMSIIAHIYLANMYNKQPRINITGKVQEPWISHAQM